MITKSKCKKIIFLILILILLVVLKKNISSYTYYNYDNKK